MECHLSEQDLIHYPATQSLVVTEAGDRKAKRYVYELPINMEGLTC
jgi:Mn-dependent DtxR family transcriptional regulator